MCLYVYTYVYTYIHICKSSQISASNRSNSNETRAQTAEQRQQAPSTPLTPQLHRRQTTVACPITELPALRLSKCKVLLRREVLQL